MGDSNETEVFMGSYHEAIDGYRADLLRARDILQQAYEFDATVVENW